MPAVCLLSFRCVLPVSSTLLDNRRRNGQRRLAAQVSSDFKSLTLNIWITLRGKVKQRKLKVTDCKHEDAFVCLYCCVVRGVVEGRRGWSVLLKESAQWVELEGSDYVLDLMSDLELPADFPKHSSYFIISAQEPTRVRPNASMCDRHTHTH